MKIIIICPLHQCCQSDHTKQHCKLGSACSTNCGMKILWISHQAC